VGWGEITRVGPTLTVLLRLSRFLHRDSTYAATKVMQPMIKNAIGSGPWAGETNKL